MGKAHLTWHPDTCKCILHLEYDDTHSPDEQVKNRYGIHKSVTEHVKYHKYMVVGIDKETEKRYIREDDGTLLHEEQAERRVLHPFHEINHHLCGEHHETTEGKIHVVESKNGRLGETHEIVVLRRYVCKLHRGKHPDHYFGVHPADHHKTVEKHNQAINIRKAKEANG